MQYFWELIETKLYLIEKFAGDTVEAQISHISPTSILIIFLAGLLTSITPCTLSMLPITVGYIGAYESKSKFDGAIQSIWFALGLATTLALLGIFATIFGKVYGQVGLGLPILVSTIAIVMGLNLLGVVPIQLPSIDLIDSVGKELPKSIRSYLLGLTFGLIASPCSTPILATILAWVASTQDLLLGGSFLFAYAVGHVAPLILAGTFTSSIKKILELRRWSSWINPVSGMLLLIFGLFSLITRIPINV